MIWRRDRENLRQNRFFWYFCWGPLPFCPTGERRSSDRIRVNGRRAHTHQQMRSEREKTNNLAIVQHYNPYHGAILIHDYSRGHTLTSSLFSYCSRSVCSFWLSSLLSSCSLSLRLLWASIWVCMSVIVVWNLELTSFLLSSSSRCRATLSS